MEEINLLQKFAEQVKNDKLNGPPFKHISVHLEVELTQETAPGSIYYMSYGKREDIIAWNHINDVERKIREYNRYRR